MERDKIHKLSNLIAEQMVNDNPKLYDLLPREEAKKKVLHEIENKLNQLPEKINQGIYHLFDQLEVLSKEKPQVISREILQNLDKLRTSPDEEVIKKDLEKGKNIKQILGLEEDTLDACYHAAVDIYNQQRYEDASHVFFVLALFDSSKYLFWLGLGNSEYLCGHFEQALSAYALAVFADPHDPRCHVYAGRCYEHLNQKENAINSFEIAIHVIEKNHKDQDYAQLKSEIHRKIAKLKEIK